MVYSGPGAGTAGKRGDDDGGAVMPEIPDKHFFKIGEVCQVTDTQPYVLRFWESEFPQLAPDKTRSGQRVYTRQDIEMVFEIKQLLYDQEFTIAGARKRLEERPRGRKRSQSKKNEQDNPSLFSTPATEVKVRRVPAKKAVSSTTLRAAEKSHKEALKQLKQLSKKVADAEHGWREATAELRRLSKENESERRRRTHIALKLEKVLKGLESLESGL